MENEQPLPPAAATAEGAAPEPAAGAGSSSEARATKFRFKSTDGRSRSDREGGSSSHRHHRRRRDDDDRHRHSRHHRSHHHRPRRRSRSPEIPDGEKRPGDAPAPPLDPDAAFRESLFDAMADEEGADYWEAVYGQPVHSYARERVNAATGELERMTDDEYAAFVRQKMWERTHAGLVEERERRARDRSERERRAEDARAVQAEVERSLRRGEERRLRRAGRARWEAYAAAWRAWDDGAAAGIPWPVAPGGERAVGEGDVRAFFVQGLGLDEVGDKEFAARLKDERVRWHPDKIQQRLGGQVDGAVMKDVTAVFQVIDKLWNDTRSKAKEA